MVDVAAVGEPRPSAQKVGPGQKAWHLALLRLAGILADDLISEARQWLADGERVDVAQAVAFAALVGGVPLAQRDVELIRLELRGGEQDETIVEDLLSVPDDSLPSATTWLFAPRLLDDVQVAADLPALLDLSDLSHLRDIGDRGEIADPGLESDPPVSTDPVDSAAVETVRLEPRISALWRAWRYPADGSIWPRPQRVYVAAAGLGVEDEELPYLSAHIQAALIEAGQDTPQVEVIPADFPPLEYQDCARANSALLWAREPAVPLRLARVFDIVDTDGGPGFAADHPTIDDKGEREQLLDYLFRGTPIMSSMSTMEDVLDPDRADVVPLTFRTDGEWIWSDTIGYYLECYRLAPEAGLLAHMRAAPAFFPALSEVRLHRVLSFLYGRHSGS